MSKCLACGYDPNRKYNYSAEILRILSKKPERTITYIKRLAKEIQENVPSEYNARSYFLFLKGTEQAKNRMIERAIEHYLRAGYHFDGKGFAYIKAMINNEKTNAAKRLQNEYKRLGRAPKITTLKGDESEKSR